MGNQLSRQILIEQSAHLSLPGKLPRDAPESDAESQAEMLSTHEQFSDW